MLLDPVHHLMSTPMPMPAVVTSRRQDLNGWYQLGTILDFNHVPALEHIHDLLLVLTAQVTIELLGGGHR
jgi:hypothetical protein